MNSIKQYVGMLFTDNIDSNKSYENQIVIQVTDTPSMN